jgi:multisubunit Na+/H+ antiporter MnhB subunit
MRRILSAIHLAAALGITVYGVYAGLFTSEHGAPIGALIIAWINISMMFLIWLVYQHIEKREDYGLINGFDTSKPFDKEIINLMLEKIIDCTVISLTGWTLSLLPLLFIADKAVGGIYIAIDCSAACLVWVPWLIIIAVKYQKAAYIVTKD